MSLPKISIVTPSFNQGAYLEETLRSVLDQNYPDLEYVVIDGGSTDNSVDVIKRYADKLTYWVSEKDGGHFDGLNKGFARTSGEVMAWINSDDKYCPWAFDVVAEIFEQLPDVHWLTTQFPIHWDARGRAIRCKQLPGFSRAGFFAGEYLPRRGAYAPAWIQQESTFWRRSLWEKAGGRCDSSLKIAGDFELWARFFEHADLHCVSVPLGGFRTHGQQFSALQMEKYLNICLDIIKKHGGKPHGAFASGIRKSKVQRVVPISLKRKFGWARTVKIVELSPGEKKWKVRTW